MNRQGDEATDLLTAVLPEARGPYTPWVWPAIQAISTAHQKTSSGLASKVHFIVTAACSR